MAPSRKILLLCLAALTAAVNIGPVVAQDGVLVIGKVSDNPRKHYRRLKPMVDYAVERMGDIGIREGRVLMARDNAQMIRFLREGKVDWVTETAFSAQLYVDRAGAELLLRKWKKGVPEYHTVFITRRDSDIRSLADLRGRTLALEDPGSTTAFFVPYAELLDYGLEPMPLESPRQAPAPDRVGYAFAGGEINIATWVHKGLADAGAYNNLDWETPDHTPPGFREELRIFHRSEPFPRALEVVRGDLPATVKQRLKAILLAATESEAGREAMAAYQKTARFDPINAEVRRQLRRVKRLLERVQEVRE